MLVVIAPYSPVGRSQKPHLGAARKIESVVVALAQLGEPIVFINTAHENEIPSDLSIDGSVIAGVSLTEITPPTYAKRRYGKFLNLFDVAHVADAVLTFGNPQLVWLYNGYAMESLLGVELYKRTNCKIVQEMEDWHFSRGRGVNPKPLVDWWCWRSAARKAAHIFAVNESVADKARRLNSHVSLFPGVVTDDVAVLPRQYPPFSSANAEVILGYFGGLSNEKGTDQILSLYNSLPPQYRFIVTGAGPLEDDVKLAASRSGGRLEFHGRVDDETLVGLIARCDVLLNPHSPIADMSNGVFPFKVIESIASGRLLISTPLPTEGLEDVIQGVCFANHDTEHLQQAVLEARNWFNAHNGRVEAGADAAVRRFGLTVILTVVKRLLPEVAA